MNSIFYNDDNLTKEEIDETVIRVKAIMINSSNEILIGYCDNSYQFPGGHIKENESLEAGLKREILEETGIELSKIEPPFLTISYYNKNYRNKGKNRENIIYYYLIKNNKLPNYNKINLDEHELKGKYKLELININDIEILLKRTINDNPINKLIYKEIFEVIKELKNININRQ